MERLRELGYSVDAVTGPAGGYRLHVAAAMPALLLDDDEAVANRHRAADGRGMRCGPPAATGAHRRRRT
jgi:hypothetical protein